MSESRFDGAWRTGDRADHAEAEGLKIPALPKAPLFHPYSERLLGPRVGTVTKTTLPAATTATIDVPAGTVEDALMFTVIASNGAVSAAPSGWVSLGSQPCSSGPTVASTYYRFAGANEPASHDWSFGVSQAGGYLAYTFAYFEVDRSVVPRSAVNQDATGTTALADAVTLGAHSAWLAVVYRDNGVGASTPANWVDLYSDGYATLFLLSQAGANASSGTQSFTTPSGFGVTFSIAVDFPATVRVANMFESGDLAGFGPSLQAGPANPSVISDPTQTPASGYVAQFDVLASQERQELITGGDGTAATFEPVCFQEGDEIYFACAYWLDASWPVLPSGNDWQVLHQWPTPTPSSVTGSPVGLIAGAFNTSTWLVCAQGFPGAGSTEAHTLGALNLGGWTRFVVRIRFSTSPTDSLVQIWKGDGDVRPALVFDSQNKSAETLNSISVETRAGWWPSFLNETAGSAGGTFRTGCLGGYEKHGIYRDPTLASDAHCYATGVRWAYTLQELLR